MKAGLYLSGSHSRKALPHIKREGAAYFVTFRLAGTLPADVLLRFKREREAILHNGAAQNRPLTWHEERELFRWYARRVDQYLDMGQGECWLLRNDVADLTATALQYFDGSRYQLHAWVVMPNHVHVVLRPLGTHSLSPILKSWKGYTARQANRILNRTGSFWQVESYDHLIRDDDDFAACCRYTILNPVNAHLCRIPEDWSWSSAHRPL